MKVIVIGATAAGLSAAAKAKRMRPDITFAIYERTGYTSYGACGLPYFVEGKVKDAQDLVTLTPQQLTDERGLPVYIHHEAVGLDAQAKSVLIKNLLTGETFRDQYDKLVLATGARAVLPPIAGIDGPGVYVLKTVEDAIRLREAAQADAHAIILGGGLIGLEVADALRSRGLEVDVVEALPRLLPFFEEEYSRQIADTLQTHGVRLHAGASIAAIENKQGAFEAAVLSNGLRLKADFLVVAAGVQPNNNLALQAGLATGLRGAIQVDSHMRTSNADIYACGDCVSTRHLLTGQEVYIPLGTTANKQGRVAGENLVGTASEFAGVLGSQVTKVFDLWIASTGLNLRQAREAGLAAESVRIQKNSLASYYPGGRTITLTLIFAKNGGRLLGAQGSGDESVAGRINTLAAAVACGMGVDKIEELDLVYTPSVAPVYDPILIAAAQAVKKTAAS